MESINYIIAEHLENEINGEEPRVFVEIPIKQTNDRRTLAPPPRYEINYVLECTK